MPSRLSCWSRPTRLQSGTGCGDLVSDQRHRARVVKSYSRVAGARQAQRPNQELRAAIGGSQPDHACDHQADFTGHAPRAARRFQKHQRRAIMGFAERQVETLGLHHYKCARRWRWIWTTCIKPWRRRSNPTTPSRSSYPFSQRVSRSWHQQPCRHLKIAIQIVGVGVLGS